MEIKANAKGGVDTINKLIELTEAEEIEKFKDKWPLVAARLGL